MPDAPKKKTTKKAAKRSSRRTSGASTSESGGNSSRSTSTRPRPTPAAVPSPAPPVARNVTIRNRVGQVIFPSVLNDDGAPTQLRLGPYATSVVPEDRLTEYTRSLAAQGKLTIDPPR